MSDIQEVDIFIKPNGEVAYEVRGVKGKKCLDVTKALEADLGGEILCREETSGMHEMDVREKTLQRISCKE